MASDEAVVIDAVQRGGGVVEMKTACPMAGTFLGVAREGVRTGEVVPGAAEGEGVGPGGEVKDECEEGWGGHVLRIDVEIEDEVGELDQARRSGIGMCFVAVNSES